MCAIPAMLCVSVPRHQWASALLPSVATAKLMCDMLCNAVCTRSHPTVGNCAASFGVWSGQPWTVGHVLQHKCAKHTRNHALACVCDASQCATVLEHEQRGCSPTNKITTFGFGPAAAAADDDAMAIATTTAHAMLESGAVGTKLKSAGPMIVKRQNPGDPSLMH
jgi:hypothetical protein